MKNNILFIGFGLGSNRKEAVNINYKNHINKVISANDNCYKYSLSSENGVLQHLLLLLSHISEIYSIIRLKKITHVHDLFVLPVISIIFLFPIKMMFPEVKLIKELHNNFGFSKQFNIETLLRFILSSKISIYILLKIVDHLYTRSEYLSKFWNIKYIPQYVNIYKLKSKTNIKPKVFNICYLGHPLRKKGIYIFPELISKLRSDECKMFRFNFAFSDLGEKDTVVDLIKSSVINNGVQVKFKSTVKPNVFFRQNNIFLLPLVDEYSATSVPNTILEAMEAGCVVITLKNKINSTVIKNNSNGLLVNGSTTDMIMKAINGLVFSKKAYSEISFNSRKYIEVNYNLSYIKDCFREIYDK